MNEEYVSVSVNDSGMDYDPAFEFEIDVDDGSGQLFGDSSVSGNDFFNGSDRSGGANSEYGPLDVSGNGYAVVDVDDQLLSSIRDEITALNTTVFLVFVFLLLSWTEKKFSVIVNRFTRERK